MVGVCLTEGYNSRARGLIIAQGGTLHITPTHIFRGWHNHMELGVGSGGDLYILGVGRWWW